MKAIIKLVSTCLVFLELKCHSDKGSLIIPNEKHFLNSFKIGSVGSVPRIYILCCKNSYIFLYLLIYKVEVYTLYSMVLLILLKKVHSEFIVDWKMNKFNLDCYWLNYWHNL